MQALLFSSRFAVWALLLHFLRGLFLSGYSDTWLSYVRIKPENDFHYLNYKIQVQRQEKSRRPSLERRQEKLSITWGRVSTFISFRSLADWINVCPNSWVPCDLVILTHKINHHCHDLLSC